MAQFDYNVTYDGKEIAPGLYGVVSDAIEGVSEKLNLRPMSVQTVAKRYIAGDDERTILMGIASSPGKSEGSERARLTFSGLEGNILNFKSQLIEALPKLELT